MSENSVPTVFWKDSATSSPTLRCGANAKVSETPVAPCLHAPHNIADANASEVSALALPNGQGDGTVEGSANFWDSFCQPGEQMGAGMSSRFM